MKKSESTANSIFFDELVENAFDFLESAINEFKVRPKYSVVHFCTAIELILKARLVHEHWYLVVDGNTDIDNFKKGNFKSINYSELLPKIKGLTGQEISKDLITTFKEIGDNRNKMVHFFHEVNSKSSNQKQLGEIAINQSKAWLHLKSLLEEWSSIFSKYNIRISQMDARMKTHKIFLQEVYNQVKKEIDNHKLKGAVYRNCSRCELEASYKNAFTSNIAESTCKVCDLKENIITIECPECDTEIELSDYKIPNLTCSNCDEEIDKDQIDYQLNSNPSDYYGGSDDLKINCALCLSTDCVIEHADGDYYLCKDCFAIEKSMQVCESCGDGEIGGGDLEYSFANGCEFCYGQVGRSRDD